MLSGSPFRIINFSLFLVLLVGNFTAFRAQESAAPAVDSGADLSGIVVDQNGALLTGVEITILSAGGTLERTVITDFDGFFEFRFLPSDEYTLKISKDGFDPGEVSDLFVAAENPRRLKIELRISPIVESIKVEAESETIARDDVDPNTFDRRRIEQIPSNGRNHQSLVNLIPGIVFTPVDSRNLGQFSSNGQRTNANFFTVDGVSANFGTTNYDFLGQTGSGSIPSANVQGGLDNLVSAESLQEVTVRTLDFAPASGKTPGATVAFVSKSGGSDFSVSAFENFRSDRYNARDFFDLEKPPHAFDNFGGSVGGPLFTIGRKRSAGGAASGSYFFFAYESKKFTLPQQAVVTEVPSVDIRKDAENPVAKAIYDSFPVPNGELLNWITVIRGGGSGDDLSPDDSEALSRYFPQTGMFRATYSDPSKSENYNLRLDQLINSRVSVFARYNYSPSSSENRNPANMSSYVSSDQITRTLTIGSTQIFSSRAINEIRFNTSKQNSSTVHNFDGLFGGSVPKQTIFIPEEFDPAKTHFRFTLKGFSDSLVFFYGNYARNEMRQFAFSDNFSYTSGSHEIKAGFDFRQLSPTLRAPEYGIDYSFNSADAITHGLASRVSFYKNPNVATNVLSVSSYVQDNWKVAPRLNLIYGLRWEINPAPASSAKNALLTLDAAPDLSVRNQNELRLAAAGTPYYQTNYRNFAPRFGAAYEVFDKNGKQLVVRGGIGTFYDLGQAQFNEIASLYDHSNSTTENMLLPISENPPDTILNPDNPNNRFTVVTAASDYRLPRTYFWNLAAQLKIGNNQMFSAAYVGGAGRHLQRTLTLNLAKSFDQTEGYFSERFAKIIYVDNAYSSDYNALQIQYARTLGSGLSAFVNYSLSRSIDNSSSDSNFSTQFFNYSVDENRGNSDFDARHLFNVGFSYQLPSEMTKSALGFLFRDLTFGGIVFARSGLPYDVKIAEFNANTNDFEYRRADFVSGVPLFLKAADSPTGRKLNPDAFRRPDGQFTQGNLGRNVFSGPSVWQFDASLNKKIRIAGKLNLHLRAEVYNVFNRPNFSNPQTNLLYEAGETTIPINFGMPEKTMARGYASSEPTGGVSPVFQLGGARAVQFGVRLSF